ncbi:hypothetical protein [Vibrio cyclitrophicus]|uniref:hypothetical protein n=1 Tax=Vibrio cyclitrophicus TaxID=47951 RepID=UPI000C854B6D|nr:hypothetical protein [Vibrio cyclitrophicus]PMF18928.1 hypothetical protein BCV24_10750 [Vibrio cyclitrophicus]
MQLMNDIATPSMSGTETLNSNELKDIFSQSPFEYEVFCEGDNYHVVFQFNVGQYKHEFDSRTYYARINNSGLPHLDYMTTASSEIIAEVKNYAGKIASIG